MNRNKFVFYIGASLLLLFILGAGCNAKNNVSTLSNESEDEIEAPTEEILPTATHTAVPTSVPTVTEMPTAVPTETPVPELGLVEDGIVFWTIPIDSIPVTISSKGASDDYLDSNMSYMENEIMNIQVPANYVVVEVHFNQPMPSGVKFQVLELDAITPWFEAPFSMNSNDANSGEMLINHRYIINPPFWEITYHARIVDGTGKVFWEKDLRIFKALPNTCWDGSLPDPVTLYCKNFDGDWNYRDFPGFNPYADMFTSGQWDLDDEYYYVTPEG